jgi:hypothetical protein
MRNLTLSQALQLNKAVSPKTNRQSTLQIKNWYAQGYFLKPNRRWCTHGAAFGRDGRKYTTY